MARRRFVMIEGELVEVGADYIGAAPEAKNTNPLAGDRHYDGMRATDGTPIDTRSKHRAYMKEKGLTTADDFKNQWSRDKSSREDYFQHGTDSSRREAVERAFHEHVDKRR